MTYRYLYKEAASIAGETHQAVERLTRFGVSLEHTAELLDLRGQLAELVDSFTSSNRLAQVNLRVTAEAYHLVGGRMEDVERLVELAQHLRGDNLTLRTPTTALQRAMQTYEVQGQRAFSDL